MGSHMTATNALLRMVDECKELNDGYACAHTMRELGIEVTG